MHEAKVDASGPKVSDLDVTDRVEFYNNDDECLPLVRCVCGKRWQPWDFIISIYRENACRCDNCGRKMYFRLGIQVFEVVDD